ncbi:hypothetical protein [Desulfuribacillus alkaliarsenatis]|uniref:Uncharacterized protein n=1 Tax=Desulfuribacillus alkaliarsenatis TaxID=766136 RepID=A0A1E5G289_9FIRM|nr:hypothetical protein [Desulfuribacillus alkaliarsenatis]OEF97089.1 hypothetical protein BHF68_05685 [Desulfuribacillus alkaliarsenatis]
MSTNSNLTFNPKSNGFRNITPVNGFDTTNPDNAMQNNYAWSMTELGDYIYVGTARNIPYSIFENEVLGPVTPPKALTPKNPVNAGEIWRRRTDSVGNWERVYRSPENIENLGFRFMITYTNPHNETAIYAGALTLTPQLFMLKSTDGVNWQLLDTDIAGYSTRYMAVHNGKLYMGALPLMGQADIQLYSSFDPERDGWKRVPVNGESGKNPRGNVDLLLSFNNHLYVGTARGTGFELWRTLGAEPKKNKWKLVVDKGAGDARNEHPWSIAVFKNHIYIGTAIEAAVLSINPEQTIVPPKGFDVIRVDKEDNWELVVGGNPVVPTNPKTGTRGKPLSGFRSGFGNLSNAYCWQIQAQGDELYLGTFSWSILIPYLLPLLPEILGSQATISKNNKSYQTAINDFVKYHLQAYPQFSQFNSEDILERLADIILRLGRRTFGFDLWKSMDGITWVPVSLNGLGNPHNYGVRMLFLSKNNDLFLGTANPFDGLEVWVRRNSARRTLRP